MFVCSQNRLRSLTAERMYGGFLDYEVKSAGTSPEARVRLTKEQIRWADLIVVMEKKHARILKENFRDAAAKKTIICLNIPDIYRCMDPALVSELKVRLAAYVEVPGQD